MSTHNVIASSATTGFFQPLPILPPQYSTSSQSSRLPPSVDNDNPVLARILSLYLPTPLPAAIHSALQNFARIALSPETLRLTVDAEVDRPTLHPLTTFGEQNNTASLRTSEGWKGLNKIAIQSGMVALGYKGVESHPSFSYNTRVHQHATSHIWAGSAALCECPSSMSDGAAILLGLQLDVDDGDQPGRASVLQEARRRIISRDPSQAWISGQWMTERIGGSDVSRTETIARKADDAQLHCDAEIHSSRVDAVGMPLGRWRVDGFKWFSSATDADMVILLARTPKGISLFYAPMRRTSRNQAVMNGVRLSRLKDKLGTKALPTAELEINGMWAWLIGDEGNGVKEITALLNTTRIWSGGIAVGLWSRGLAISRAFSRARTIKAGLLEDNKQHLAWMAEQTIKFRASTHLLFLGVALLGISERGSSALSGTRAKTIFSGDIAETKSLLRVVTPLVKAQCSLASVSGVRSCMESLGGVGYCENNEDYGIMNVARLFRDVNVNCIWEGTTSVMVEDVFRVWKGKTASTTQSVLDKMVQSMLKACDAVFSRECRTVRTAWTNLVTIVSTAAEAEALHVIGRELLQQLEAILAACLLMVDASGDLDEIAVEVAKRWVAMKFPGAPVKNILNLAEKASMDKKIFLGLSQTNCKARAKI